MDDYVEEKIVSYVEARQLFEQLTGRLPEGRFTYIDHHIGDHKITLGYEDGTEKTVFIGVRGRF